MALKSFYVDRMDYKKKVRPAILKTGIEDIKISGFPTSDIFYFKKTGVTLIYDSKKGMIIAGKSIREVRRTISKLEKLSGVKLTEF